MNSLSIATLCNVLALVFADISIAGDDYRAILLIALGATIVASPCCAIAIAKKKAPAIAAVVTLPSLFVVYEFVRRAPTAFGF